MLYTIQRNQRYKNKDRKYLNLKNFFLNIGDRIYANLGRLDQEITIHFSQNLVNQST